MARNIEIKARARAFDDLRERAAALSSDAPLIFRQQDFFYDVPRGRLKLSATIATGRRRRTTRGAR
jgi:adenylate cyclase class IV